ncbi:Glutathione import ATP-binding protein GsiA [Microbacterium lemovicicum]|uniref:Glutathione import ATP-binding protein GsiA n=1 Tax=Microbacterium lemovicicum TaxID=1072463 RepID=A0A3Q9IXU7_9MICO|nr:ABC transporter ATP-binding protein [Microbacterium lemovicicum]AZS35716.1 Glutathione import ATP-binding protein GsiA [Microbacterium lemovicicum]
MTAPDSVIPLLSVRNLSVGFSGERGAITQVVDEVSFDIDQGRILGVVGESGSGKSVTARAVMRMLAPSARVTSGSVLLRGDDILRAPEKRMRAMRGRDMGMVFQDPQSTLNPIMRIGDQIEESLRIHGVDRDAARLRVRELLEQVGISDPERARRRFPHEFSGGMRQRVVIATALANSPSLLIADEPTTALDVTVQAQVLNLLLEMRRELGIAILLITHDMGVVADTCDEVLVMNGGRVVESGPVGAVLTTPKDAYTRRLLAAIPDLTAPTRPAPPASTAVLQAREVRTVIGGSRHGHVAVDGVSLSIARGETLGLVGESGCGKSSLSKTLVGLLPAASGSIELRGSDVTAMTTKDRARLSDSVQYVFQDPLASLNPRRTVAQSLEEAIETARGPRRDPRARSTELLERVGLGPESLDRYPHAFSGGQRQRIGIARALAADPEIIILDEPVSALDVSIQAQVLDLLVELQDDLGVGYLFISHDLAVIRSISHRVMVMRAGRIVEEGDTDDVFERPQHEYTQQLLSSIPRLEDAE